MNYMLRSTIFFYVICFGPVLSSYNFNVNNNNSNNNNYVNGGDVPKELLEEQQQQKLEQLHNFQQQEQQSIFRFSQTFYNASVAENSVASTLVVPTEKMGIWNPDPRRRIHYSIVSGDSLQMFRVEPLQVGDFCFLILRVNQNDRILNREFKELYKVQVKAVVHAESNELEVEDSSSGSLVLKRDEIKHEHLWKLQEEERDKDKDNEDEHEAAEQEHEQFDVVSGVIKTDILADVHDANLQSSSSRRRNGENQVNFQQKQQEKLLKEKEKREHKKREKQERRLRLNSAAASAGETNKKTASAAAASEISSIDSESLLQDHLDVLPEDGNKEKELLSALHSSSSLSSPGSGSSSGSSSSSSSKSSSSSSSSTSSSTSTKTRANNNGPKEKNRLISEIPAAQSVHNVQSDQQLGNDERVARRLGVIATPPSVRSDMTTASVFSSASSSSSSTSKNTLFNPQDRSKLWNPDPQLSSGSSAPDSASVEFERLTSSVRGGGNVRLNSQSSSSSLTFSSISGSGNGSNSASESNNDNNNNNNSNSGSNSGSGRKNRSKKPTKKSLRRNSRDDQQQQRRNSKSRNRNKSGEKRKNRKDKQIISPISSKIPNSYSSDVETTTSSTTVRTPRPPPPLQQYTLATTKRPSVALLEATTIVYIKVIDVDDNNPMHESSEYDIVVNEDASILSKVFKVTAADADIGRNQEIYYSIPQWSDHWAIDPITGVLSPIRPLDSRSKELSRQQIRVRARNRWSSSSSSGSIAAINIQIRPVNRHAPTILITRPPQVEIRPYGVIYAVVAVRDQDEGENGLVDLSIKEGDPNGFFHVSPTTSPNEFYIEMSPIVARSFDLRGHKSQSFNLTLKAADRGYPSKSSEKDLHVKVTGGIGSDRNAMNPAIFDKDLYEVEIPETAPPHSIVFRFKRPDSKVLLSISSGNEGEDFYLEEKSGVLYTAKWLDAESKSSYVLTIDSRDRRPGRMDSSRIRQSVAKIIVKVRDCNDNDPILRISYPSNSTEIFINENDPVGSKVAKITARDLDQGENGYVTYNIANLKPTPFSIDHFTGEIRTSELLDYETSRRNYKLKIRASDWGQPSRRESEITISINLKNTNDNRPVNLLTNCIAVIDRNIKFETEFGKLEAIDFDRNDVVLYRIVGGNEDSCFAIDMYKGTLRVMCDLRDLRAAKRWLNVTASDGEYYSDVMTVKIELSDGLRSHFNKTDSIKNGIKLFSTSQSVFECQDTGIQERYDRMAAMSEENNKIDETDLIEDGLAPLPSRYGENIHTPQFIDTPNEVTVNESIEVGSTVLTLRGRDIDKGYNGLLTFVISNGDEVHGAFDVINLESGTVAGVTEARLVVALPLDREEIPYYVLNFTVYDSGRPAKQASKLITIKISDTNDESPVFVKPAMKIRFGEGAQLIGEALLQVTATDGDEPGTPNSLISYRLLNDFPEFTIDDKTGVIRLMKDLDRERQDLYEILVIAEDHGSPKRLSSIAVVTIVVEDVNDNKPVFESEGASKYRIAKIREDWPVGAVVTRIFAKDEDLGLAGTVRYTLVDGDKGDFSLDEISGVLRVRQELDYTHTSIYNLTISARDMGTPSLVTESFVVVEVFDVRIDTQLFTFPEIVITTAISEDAPVGTIVANVAPPSFSETKYPGVIFSLEGTTRFLFSIDQLGVLRTAHSLNHEEQASHWVAVVARSLINGDSFARLEVFINVTDVNECLPLTKEPIYYTKVVENSEAGLSVLKVEAFDCDSNININSNSNSNSNLHPIPNSKGGSGFRFAIKGSTPYFEINPETGEIQTTDVPLDREKQSEHSFDIVVFDFGSPPLNSTTKVVVSVLDENDMKPTFFIRSGSIHSIPELRSDLQGDEPTDYNDNLVEMESEDFEDALKWSEWQVLDVLNSEDMVNAEGWKKIYRVVAFDGDALENGTVSYRLKYRVSTGANSRDDEVFSIHPQSGEIYTSASVVKNNTILKFVIEASDQSKVPLKTEIELLLKVKGINKQSSKTPVILLPSDQVVSITTKEKPGYTVETIDAMDPDGEQLWYEIVSGDPDQHFIILPDSQNLILARPVLKEQEFRLNISVSDGFNNVFTQLLVRVIETERTSSLIWEKESYTAFIHESTTDFQPIITVRVNDTVSTNWTRSASSSSTSISPVLYGFHNSQDLRSLRLFSIDSLTGQVSIARSSEIDRETLPQHIITVKARDPQQLYSFVRLVINVVDSNDVAPVFPSGIYGGLMRAEVRIPETTAVGTLITQIEAFDLDDGENGRLSYSITFGNTANTFGIERETGWLYLNRPLQLLPGQTSMEYQLTLKAEDGGRPQPLFATTNVNIMVTLASDEETLALRCDDEDKHSRANMNMMSGNMIGGRRQSQHQHQHPQFYHHQENQNQVSWVHIKENSKPGTYVTSVRVDNSISVSFELIEDNKNNMFWIDSTTGVIFVGKRSKGLLDRETKSSHEIKVRATNLRGLTATCRIKVILEDVNDNAPSFTVVNYEGQISELSPLGTLVLEKESLSDGTGLASPSSALSSSSSSSAETSRQAVNQLKPLVLHSTDADVGKNALVTYSIIEDEEMRTVFHIDPSTGALLLVTPLDYEKRPVYQFNVRAVDEGGLMSPNIARIVVHVQNENDNYPAAKSARVELLLPTVKGFLVHTVDAKDADGDSLEFNISRGNVQGFFHIEKDTGHIRIAKTDNFVGTKHVLEVSVSDGKFTSLATINIHVKFLEKNPRFAFRNQTFSCSAMENSTKIVNLLSLSVLGAEMNEHLRFRILNPTPYFGIMQTSGVIFTLGKKLDRELEPRHNLLVEVQGEGSNRLARCFVEVQVKDINDSPPNFLSLPYVAVIPIDAKPGDSVMQVKCHDADEGENAVIRFELVRSPYGDIYDLDKHTGEIRMRRKPDGVGEHIIIIKAYDHGVPTLSTEAPVQIKIVTHDQPIFEQQFYETWIPEDAAIQSTALALVAHAKNPIMYSIEAGNEYDEFGIDYQTGVLYVNSPLDFETQTMHRLTIRATDLVSSSWSSTIVSVRLRDSNDRRPVFEQPQYHIIVTEGFMPPSGIVAIVRAHDNDTGINAMLTYEIVMDDVLSQNYRQSLSQRGRGTRHLLERSEGEDEENAVDVNSGEEDTEEEGESGSGNERERGSESDSSILMMSEDATSNNRSLDASRWFLIKPNDGAIVLKQVLDYERFHELRFSVVVRDAGLPSLSSTSRVIVSVVGINDNAQIVEKSVYTARVSETAPRGHVVAKITAYDPDEMDTLRYAIVGSVGSANAFAIDEKTGIVRLVQPKVLLTEMSFSLNISVTDGVFSSFTRLHIDVEPRNHHAPSFSSGIYEVGCPENSPDGFLISTLSANDPDRSIFGQVRYFLADTDEPGLFVVNENTGEVRLSSSPDASLDREYKESHTLEIAAQDLGGWIGFTKLAVKIIGVNEFPPVFVCSEYRVTIPHERMRSKNPVLQVIANDADTEFGIRYSIVDLPEHQSQSLGMTIRGNSSMKRDSTYFEINGETGEVRLKMTEDDIRQFGVDRVDFQFWARAEDEGRLHSHVPVTVVVLPPGQPTPGIEPQNATFFVQENSAVGSLVTTFHVTNIVDPKFRVVSSNDEFFQVDSQGNLLINARLDQEQEDKYTVVVWAESADGMSVASSQVEIRLLDSNDNPPTFNAQQYNIKVAEDFPEGSLIFKVHASDADKNRNVKQRYSLVPSDSSSTGENSHFSVNQEHGWITLANKLDYEMNTIHTIHVVATDSEKPHLMSTCTVVVEVLNVNDNPQSFDTSHYYASVREDVAEGTVVATVHTTDLDDVRSNSTTISSSYSQFYIIEGNDKGHFKINDRTGEISVWRTLDAEVDQKFELRILSTDGFYTDHANVTINILDVNDNVPICPVPEYEHQLMESDPIGKYVATMEASDPDISGPSPTFSLSGKGSEDFEIDPETGIISTRQSLDRELKWAFYSLMIHAEDKQSRFECTSVLRISVGDVNDNPPVFTEKVYTVTVKEDAQIGALIGKVHADDVDAGVNKKIKYSLLSTIARPDVVVDNQFGIDASSGVLSLLRPLDRELVSHYNLSIQAVDGGSPPILSTTSVYVIVLDINDNPPEWQFNYYSSSISELATINTEVTRVMATSKDINENADITYKIVGGNGYNHFGIHPKTGLIFVNASLDYEKVREYVLAVRAQDGGVPPLASQCLVNITITDYNDNTPQFSSSTYSVQVPEDAVLDTSVMQVVANDLDSGLNSAVVYEIVAGDRLKHFQIDPSKGIITVASALDREMISGYSLEIRATDRGVPPLSSSVMVEVNVLDKNDNPPFFENKHESYSAIVQEDRPIGYTVLTFTVSDADSPPNSAPFSWDLRDYESPSGAPLPFTVSDSGTLNVAGKLNFQRKNLYKFHVRVFDNGEPPLYSDANVTIKVVDKSQWPPVVSSLTVTAITADEIYPSGVPLGVVHASDYDPYDTLSYSLLETQSSSIFTIDLYNGSIKSLVPLREGSYELGVGVSDGRWTARGEAYIKIITLASLIPDVKIADSSSSHFLPSEAPLPPLSEPSLSSKTGQSRDRTNNNNNKSPVQSIGARSSRKDISSFAIVMTLSGHTPSSLLTRIFGLISVVKEAMGVEPNGISPYDVFILSVQSTKQNQSEGSSTTTTTVEDVNSNVNANSNGNGNGSSRRKRESGLTSSNEIPSVDVLLAVRTSIDGNFVLPAELIKKLRFALPQIEAVLQGRVVRLTYDICKEDSCDRGQCRTLAVFDGSQSLISTETLSLITPIHQLETHCFCQPGYGGPRCDKVVNACAHSDCISGYICVPDSSTKGYACLCRKTYCSPDGNCEDHCAQQSVSFSGTSFLAYNVGPSLERELSVSMRIKTLYTSGTLLHTYGHFDYAVLQIKQGLVQFSWDLGTGKEVLTVTSISVSDNRWHKILLQIRDNYAILRVDERSTQRQKSQGPARSLHTGGVIYIGARIIGSSVGGVQTLESLIPAQGFVGCMKDLRYGYMYENMSSNNANNVNGHNGKKLSSEMHIQEVKHYITPNLNRMNAEIDLTLDEDEEGEPENEEPFDPRNARMPPLPLHTSDKNVHGSHLLWSRNISFSCERILHVVEACRNLPCHNGGTCLEDRTANGYKCICASSRYHGLNCEIDLDPCAGNPCLNNGRCTPTTSSPISFSPSLVGGSDSHEPQFYCHCIDGTFGSRCERGRWCKNSEIYGDSEVCNRRGDCEDGPIGPICWCEKGYTGSTCQLDVNECERGDACGPASTCVNFQGGFRCLCPANATGTRCNRLLTTPSIVNSNYKELLLIGIGLIFIIMLIFVFVFVRRCCIARERNQASNTIPLTSAHMKDKDNRAIPIGRDNREQVLRNRDSKISNLEVRPVSATSDLFSAELRAPLNPIKTYSSVDLDDLEKPPPFIVNNLMKGSIDRKRIPGQSWDSNRDDYAKIQNYVKDEINQWASKGSKPSSPVSTGTSSGYHWDNTDLTQPCNISPIRTLPPPDIPDSLSIISHDSNSEVPSINLAALPPIDSLRDMDTLVEEEDGDYNGSGVRMSLLDEGTSCDEGGPIAMAGWQIPHPDQYLLSHQQSDTTDQEDSGKPIALNNRYRKKNFNFTNNSHINGGGSSLQKQKQSKQGAPSQICEISDDEINENSMLLSPSEVLNPNVVVSSHSAANANTNTTTNSNSNSHPHPHQHQHSKSHEAPAIKSRNVLNSKSSSQNHFPTASIPAAAPSIPSSSSASSTSSSSSASVVQAAPNANSNGNVGNNTSRKSFSKTTHITQV